jgi:hypothetical protein
MEKGYDMEKIAKVTQKWHKMFSDRRISTEDFIMQKSVEKALEES